MDSPTISLWLSISCGQSSEEKKVRVKFIFCWKMTVISVDVALFSPKIQAYGPYGAKGFCEMSANAQLPAIISAIHNVIGVWIEEWPIGPEVVFRARAFKET